VKPGRLLLLAVPPAALTAAAVMLGAGSTGLHVVLTLDSAYIVLVVLARLRRAWPPSDEKLGPGARAGRAAASVPALERVDTALLFSKTSALDFERHLRPLLFAVALSRLKRRGIDAGRQPEQAERLLGSRVWKRITPPPDRPDRDAPGVPAEAIEAIVSKLEEV